MPEDNNGVCYSTAAYESSYYANFAWADTYSFCDCFNCHD
jgi:hypothetical protein